MAVNQIKAGVVLNYVILGLNALTGLLYTPFMLRCLGQSEYGVYALAGSVIAYLTLLDFGFGNAVVRYTAKYRAQGDEEGQSRLFGMFTVVYSILGVLALAAGMVLYAFTGEMFGSTLTEPELHQTRVILLLMVANVALSFPLSIFGSIIYAYEDFVFQKVVSIIRIVLCTGVLVVVLLLGYKALGLVVVQTVFSFAFLFINLWYCFKKLHIRLIFGRINWPLMREIGVYTFWIFLNMIMDKVYWNTGQFVLGATISAVAVAVYGLGIMLSQIYTSYSVAISGVFLPRVTAMVTKHADPREVSDLFIRTGRLQYLIMGLLTMGFIVFGLPFIRLWAGNEYAATYPIALLLLLASFTPLIQNMGITILQARNQMKFRSILYVCIAAVSLVFQILLSHKWGGLGCAIATAGALILGQGIVMNIYYQRKQKINILRFWWEIGKMSVAPLVWMVAWLVCLPWLNVGNFGMLIIWIMAFTIGYALIMWVFSMNEYERQLMRGPLRRLHLIRP